MYLMYLKCVTHIHSYMFLPIEPLFLMATPTPLHRSAWSRIGQRLEMLEGCVSVTAFLAVSRAASLLL